MIVLLSCSYVKKPDQKISYETSSNNLHGRRTTAATETVDSGKKGNITHIDYNPTSGVTFRENHNSDVQVVGKGYVEDTSDIPLKASPSVAVSRLKERKRLNSKGMWTFKLIDVAFVNPKFVACLLVTNINEGC